MAGGAPCAAGGRKDGECKVTGPALFVPAFPTIRPEMWLPFRGSSLRQHYPFSAASAQYFYFARNAIWRAVRELGLSGGEVLVPAYHHGVEIEALIDAGVSPRFYSVGPQFEIDLQEIERAIGRKTRALYLTHFLGFPGPVRAMKALAEKHGIPLIEDCALALFSADADLPLGVTGDAAIFCLYKVLAVPDGGVLVYPEREGQESEEENARPQPPFTSSLASVASSTLRNVALRGGRLGRGLRRMVLGVGKGAMRASKVEPVLAGTQHFNRGHARFGMSLLTRLLLGAQDVPQIVARRRRNYNFLLEQLKDVSPPLFKVLPEGVVPLCYPMLVEDNKEFMERLVSRGIEAVDFWREGHPSCDTLLFPHVARLRRSLVEIPCHQDINEKTLALMVKEIRAGLAPRT